MSLVVRPIQHRWHAAGDTCARCGAMRRTIERPNREPRHHKTVVVVQVYSTDGGATWTEARPACSGVA